MHLARRRGSHTEVDCSAPSYKYWHIIRSCTLVSCARSSSAAKASRLIRCQCHCAPSHFVYSIGIRYAQRPSQSPFHQLHVIRVAKTSSAFLTHATLSFDRKPAIVHLALPFAPSHSPYHSINTDSVGTHSSPYPASRVNHLRPHGSSVSTSSRSEWMSIDERRTQNKRPAPAMTGHAEPPRDLAG